MSILHLPPDQAQWQLDHGYASLTDANAYADAWNRTKVSTTCRVEVQLKRPHRFAILEVETPVLIIEDLPE